MIAMEDDCASHESELHRGNPHLVSPHVDANFCAML
jgi:hypothetical protein